MDLNRDLIAQHDNGNMLGAIASLPEQLQTAYLEAHAYLEDLFQTCRVGLPAAPSGLVICGMGGSAIGGDLVLGSLPNLDVPAAVVRGYELPRWVDAHTLVIAVSYSGDTAETLACVEEALARGCAPVCICSGGRLAELAAINDLPHVAIPGGQQPRAALGLLAGPVLAACEVAGLCGPQQGAVAETVELLRRGNDELGPDAPEEAIQPGARPGLPQRQIAKPLARQLHERQVCIYGAGPTVAAARRWKGQVNENAKAPAFFNELPELDHNELMAWTSLPHVSQSTAVVFLNDGEHDDRLVLRAELTANVLEEHGVLVEHVWAHGPGRLARLFSLVQLGDYVSFYLALLYGVDPSPVAAIQKFKEQLAGRTAVV